MLLHTTALLTRPAAETPSTEKLKLTRVNPIALAAEIPDGERMEFVINVGFPSHDRRPKR